VRATPSLRISEASALPAALKRVHGLVGDVPQVCSRETAGGLRNLRSQCVFARVVLAASPRCQSEGSGAGTHAARRRRCAVHPWRSIAAAPARLLGRSRLRD